MGLLRSEAMKYGMLVLPVQDARRYIDRLGKDTNLQFEDMNSREMRRPYRKHVQRLDECERILRFMFEEIARIEGCEIQKNKVDEFLSAASSYKLEMVEGEFWEPWGVTSGPSPSEVDRRERPTRVLTNGWTEFLVFEQIEK